MPKDPVEALRILLLKRLQERELEFTTALQDLDEQKYAWIRVLHSSHEPPDSETLTDLAEKVTVLGQEISVLRHYLDTLLEDDV